MKIFPDKPARRPSIPDITSARKVRPEAAPQLTNHLPDETAATPRALSLAENHAHRQFLIPVRGGLTRPGVRHRPCPCTCPDRPIARDRCAGRRAPSGESRPPPPPHREKESRSGGKHVGISQQSGTSERGGPR
nr:unnamed protein product [Digitaria exilis]